MKKEWWRSQHIVYIGLFVLILVVDQIVKALTQAIPVGESRNIIPGAFWLTHIHNTGVSFGQFQGNNMVFIWVAIVVFGLLVWFHDQFKTRAERAAYWLVLSGLFGNLIDRIFRGAVVDMFDLGWWPVFNIADSAICVGIALLIISELFLKRKRAVPTTPRRPSRSRGRRRRTGSTKD